MKFEEWLKERKTEKVEFPAGKPVEMENIFRGMMRRRDAVGRPGILPGREEFAKEDEERDGLVPWLKSAISAGGPEMFGFDPLEGVPEYRRENPWAGPASQLVGYGTPLVAATLTGNALGVPAMLGRIPFLGRGVAAAEGMAASRPLLAGAIKDAYSLAPFEAARVAVAGGAGPEGAGPTVATEAAMDLALTPVFGGALEGLRLLRSGASRLSKPTAAGTVLKEFPDFSPEATPQDRIRFLSSARQNIPPTLSGERQEFLTYKIEELLRDAQAEVVNQKPGKRVISQMKLGKQDELVEVKKKLPGEALKEIEGREKDDAWRLTEAVFKGGEKNKWFRSAFLRTGKGGVKTAEELKPFTDWFDVRPGWHERVQYPRAVQAVGKDGKEMVDAIISDGLPNRVSADFSYGKEKNGLYVVAKKISTGENDNWVMFKTDDLGHFFPELQKTADLVERQAFILKELSGTGVQRKLSRSYRDWDTQMVENPPVGPENPVLNAPKSALGELFGKLLPKEVEALRRDLGDIVGHLGRSAKRYVATGATQFSAYPRAAWLVNHAARIYEKGEAEALAIWYGKRLDAKKGGSLFRELVDAPIFEGGLESEVMKIHKKGSEKWREFMSAIDSRESVDKLLQEGLDPELAPALRLFEKVDSFQSEDTLTTALATGEENLKHYVKQYHRMFSRVWEGTFRATVELPDGKLIGYGAGYYPKTARMNAERIIGRMDADRLAEGLPPSGARVVDQFVSSYDGDVQLALRVGENGGEFLKAKTREYRLKRFRPETGKTGYMGDLEVPTYKQFKDRIITHLMETARHNRSRVLDSEVPHYMQKISEVEGETARSLAAQRIDLMRGKSGPLSQMVKNGFDRALAPFLGANGAERIVKANNRLLYAFTLGFGDVGYPVVNMTSVLTQIAPEISYVANTVPRRAGRYYDWHLARTMEGKVMEVGSLSASRVLMRSMRMVMKPTEEFRAAFKRAIKDGRVGPRFMEEMVGKDSQLVSQFGKALKGEESLLGSDEGPQ